MSRRVSAVLSSAIALVCAVAAWIGLSAIEVEANDSLADVTTAIQSVEQTLSGSTSTATATADALDAAADALDAAEQTTASTATVASDVSDIAGTLPPVIIAVSEGLDQIDSSIDDINDLLASLPFAVGTVGGVDSELIELEQLLTDLEAAETSLDDLAIDAEAFGPETATLAIDLRAVATELRDSSDDLSQLSTDVGEARTALENDDGQTVDLLLAQLLVVGLSAAIIIGRIPDLMGERPTIVTTEAST